MKNRCFVVQEQYPGFGWANCKSSLSITFWEDVEDAENLIYELQFRDSQIYVKSKYRIKMFTSDRKLNF